MRAIALFVAAWLAGCSGGTYVVVTVDSTGPLQASAIDVKLGNAGQTASVHVTRDGGFAIPPAVSFALKLDGSRHGDSTVDLSLVDGSGAVVGQASGIVTIIAGGTARLTLTVGGVGTGADMAMSPPDLASSASDLAMGDMATGDLAKPDLAVVVQNNDVTNTSFWTSFDTTTVSSTYAGFYGGVFDGRYIYYIPHYNGGYDGIVVRHDTQAAFNDTASWTSFNLATINGSYISYFGGTFDGRYVYLSGTAPSASTGFQARYDTMGTFTNSSSWTVFDSSTVNAKSVLFAGAVFDGRYVYYVPHDSNNGMVTRYDTQAAFTTASSWSTFDASTLNANAVSFWGGIFDGRYVYFIPQGATQPSIATRYDTQAAFTASASWSVFDTTGVNAASKTFYGGAFDGRYVYFINQELTRFDTHGSFTSAGSWSAFDTTTVSSSLAGFNTASFDGRYLFFFGGNGVLARYDTAAAFASTGSWVTFNTTTINANAKGWSSSIFDGRYIYLEQYSPSNSGMSLRFDARTPSGSAVSFF